jgi:hypothetical protein
VTSIVRENEDGVLARTDGYNGEHNHDERDKGRHWVEMILLSQDEGRMRAHHRQAHSAVIVKQGNHPARIQGLLSHP